MTSSAKEAGREIEKDAALAEVQTMLCAVPGRLGRIDGEARESSAAGTARTEEGGEGETQPFVPNWPRVTADSNLGTTDEKLEWLLNCLPLKVLEGYNTFKASSVIGLGVQSAMLAAIALVQPHRMISKKARHIKNWRRMCKSAEETAEAGKARQQEMAEEVARLGAEMGQLLEQLASKDFILTEKEVKIANKEKELAAKNPTAGRAGVGARRACQGPDRGSGSSEREGRDEEGSGRGVSGGGRGASGLGAVGRGAKVFNGWWRTGNSGKNIY